MTRDLPVAHPVEDQVKHGQRQPRAAGSEVPPYSWIRDELGQSLIPPPLRPRRQPAPGISHLPQLGRQISRVARLALRPR